MSNQSVIDDYIHCQGLTKDYYNLSGAQKYIDPVLMDKCGSNIRFKYLAGTQQSREWYGYQTPDHADIVVDTDTGERLIMVQPGDVVFDCGAHTGFMSIAYAMAAGPLGHVISFDPFPQNIDLIEHNAILNGLSNITTVQKAVGSQHRYLPLSQDQQSAVKSDTNLVKTFETTLDNYKVFKPNFIKMDVEGFEVEALRGAREILALRPRLNIEVHGPLLHRFNHDVSDIIDLLPSHDDYEYYIKEFDPGTGPMGGFKRIHALDLKNEYFTNVLGVPKV